MRSLMFTFFACTLFTSLSSQNLVSSEMLGTTTTLVYQFLDLPLPINYNVDYYKVTYSTTDVDGEPTVASGAVMIPNTSECNSFPMAVYCHGTVLRRFDVPSEQNFEGVFAGAMASAGYITVAPDYLGLGEDDGVHPYVHAETQATATIDLIAATRELLESLPAEDNGEVFITGYSQGGHAAMASLKYAQDNDLLDEIGIVAGAPASGPYNLSGTQTDIILSDAPYSNPGYIVYLLIGYNSVYNNLYNELSDIIQEPYATDVQPFFDGEQNEYDMDAVNAILPSLITDLLQDSVLTNFENNPNHPLRVALSDNDNHNWTPSMPLRMYYCTGDEQVFFTNSTDAETSMQANGAENALAINVLEGGNHADCVLPAIESVYAFFDSLSTACQNTLSVSENSPEPLRLAPNPAQDHVRVFFPFREARIEVYSLEGRLILERMVVGPEINLDLSELTSGRYILSVISENKRHNTGLIIAQP